MVVTIIDHYAALYVADNRLSKGVDDANIQKYAEEIMKNYVFDYSNEKDKKLNADFLKWLGEASPLSGLIGSHTTPQAIVNEIANRLKLKFHGSESINFFYESDMKSDPALYLLREFVTDVAGFANAWNWMKGVINMYSKTDPVKHRNRLRHVAQPFIRAIVNEGTKVDAAMQKDIDTLEAEPTTPPPPSNPPPGGSPGPAGPTGPAPKPSTKSGAEEINFEKTDKGWFIIIGKKREPVIVPRGREMEMSKLVSNYKIALKNEASAIEALERVKSLIDKPYNIEFKVKSTSGTSHTLNKKQWSSIIDTTQDTDFDREAFKAALKAENLDIGKQTQKSEFDEMHAKTEIKINKSFADAFHL